MKMSKFSTKLREALEEIKQCEEGKITLRTELVEIPKPPASLKAQDIKNIRKNNMYSQGMFARVLNVSVKTVQSWESGKRTPRDASLRLLEIIDKGIYPNSTNKKN